MKPQEIMYHFRANGLSEGSVPPLKLKSFQLEIQDANGSYLIRFQNDNDKTILIKLKGEEECSVLLDHVLLIDAEKNPSNNKTVYFNNRCPGTLVNFCLRRDIMKLWHLENHEFVEVCRGVWVNRSHLRSFDGKQISLMVLDKNGDRIEKHIPVSKKKKKDIYQALKCN